MQPSDPRDQIIAEQGARITRLEGLLEKALERIADLEARLAANSTNSSKPPSSDPPGVERPQKGPTGRTRGAQPGHKGHKRELLSRDRVGRFVECTPERCEHCHAALAGRDPNPSGARSSTFPASSRT